MYGIDIEVCMDNQCGSYRDGGCTLERCTANGGLRVTGCAIPTGCSYLTKHKHSTNMCRSKDLCAAYEAKAAEVLNIQLG